MTNDTVSAILINADGTTTRIDTAGRTPREVLSAFVQGTRPDPTGLVCAWIDPVPATADEATAEDYAALGLAPNPAAGSIFRNADPHGPALITRRLYDGERISWTSLTETELAEIEARAKSVREFDGGAEG